jgi:flagellar basal-body rod protein FlgB
MFERLGSNFEQYMDVLSSRQKLVASNIANVDTPGYKTNDISDFQTAYENAKIGLKSHGEEVAGLALKPDENNVSMEREVRLLSENAIRFQIASQLATSQIHSLRAAIQDGKAT